RQADAVRESLLRVNHNGDLANITRIHLDSRNTGYATEEWPQVVYGKVAQVCIRHIAVQHQAQDRKYGGRETLKLYFRIGGGGGCGGVLAALTGACVIGSACCIRPPCANSTEISAAPRIVRDRTRLTP